jgi:hypothetical protein
MAYEAKQPLAIRKNGRALRGFQWKNVFLPDGTHLRTSYLDSIEFAKVVGDRIRSDDGEYLTPSLFVNRHTTGRNAWRFVWLRFPGDDYWIRADNCRTSAAKKLQRHAISDSNADTSEPALDARDYVYS